MRGQIDLDLSSQKKKCWRELINRCRQRWSFQVREQYWLGELEKKGGSSRMLVWMSFVWVGFQDRVFGTKSCIDFLHLTTVWWASISARSLARFGSFVCVDVLIFTEILLLEVYHRLAFWKPKNSRWQKKKRKKEKNRREEDGSGFCEHFFLFLVQAWTKWLEGRRRDELRILFFPFSYWRYWCI